MLIEKNDSKKSSLLRKSLVVGIVLTGAILAVQPVIAQEEPTYSAGATIGSMGLGLTFSSMTNWSLKEDDQIQWRAAISGIDTNDFDDVEIAGIDYKEGDASLLAIQAGLDWYPFNGGWADEIFFSTGLVYADAEFKGDADGSRQFTVGDIQVSPGDITSLTTEIEGNGIAPYLSVGWGNKLVKDRGFDFQAELGILVPTSDADVKLTVIDPDGILSADDLASERAQIQDDVDGVGGFLMLTALYHF